MVTALGIVDGLTSALAYGEKQKHFLMHQIQCQLLRDVVVGKRTGVLELLPREDESVLVRQDVLLVLNLLFHHSVVSGGSISGILTLPVFTESCWLRNTLLLQTLLHRL